MTASATTNRADQARVAAETFFDAYREQDVDRMVELCTPGAEFRYVPFEVWLRTRVVRADEKVVTVGKPIWTHLIDCFPDLSNELHSITADDDGNVAVEVTIGGLQARDFGMIKCLDKRYALPHVFLLHVDGEGLIDRVVAYWDTADWYEQLGKVQAD